MNNSITTTKRDHHHIALQLDQDQQQQLQEQQQQQQQQFKPNMDYNRNSMGSSSINASSATITMNNNNSTSSNRRRSFPGMQRKRWLVILQSSMRRLVKFKQMDWELAIWQLMWICIAPRRVYRNIYYHKQTTNQWARDDPAFLLLLCGAVGLNAVLYSLVFGLGLGGVVGLIGWMVGVELVLGGCVIATAGWYLSNKFLISNHLFQSSEQTVEWLYCFDVHCNSYVPVIFLLYFVQLCFHSILTLDGFISRLLGNTLYLVAAIFYNYITFLGYSALPFLKNTILTLYPTVLIIGFYLVSLFGMNISSYAMRSYMHSS